MSAQKFALILNVICVGSQPKTMDNLVDTSLHKKIKLCTVLQRQQLTIEGTNAKNHNERKNHADLQKRGLKSLSMLIRAQMKKLNQFHTKLKKPKMYPVLKTLRLKLGLVIHL